MSTKKAKAGDSKKKSTELTEKELNEVSGGLKKSVNATPKPGRGSSGKTKVHSGKASSTAKGGGKTNSSDDRETAPGVGTTRR